MKREPSAALERRAAPDRCTQWIEYCTDALWRAAATMDTLRERAENMEQHEKAGMPPLLHFDAEEVADAHQFSPPSNYRLLRITRCGTDRLERFVRSDAPPVIVVDPRAGHGPGIGGFRRDSEVGMALREGHPVYFVVFDPLPVDGQTVSAVVESVARVYLLDERVGHLGIFVSADIALRQHRAILRCARDIQALAPGLYQMRLDAQGGASFEPREIEDIAFDPEPSGFGAVNQLSQALDALYGAFVSPWVRLAVSRDSADLLAHWHPMRIARRCWSPQEVPAVSVLPRLREAAQPAAAQPEQREANPWYRLERISSVAVHDGIGAWRQWRDLAAELWFHCSFGAAPGALPDTDARPAGSTCATCSARHLATSADGCCQFAEHCAILSRPGG